MRKFICLSLVSFTCSTAFAISAPAASSSVVSATANTKAASSQVAVKKPAASATKQGLPDNILRAMQNSQADAAAQAKDFAKTNPQ